ncbi:TonB-dependent receptor plug domain-containing protein [Massilia horti]|uniref:TonB-dependent receptor n=1 Tax=Massilia horti TaxID=2562153 RepID=A0A4Y9STE5_9BURK|nr:TonB-dependent receptor [Massilia horti]TFW29891.1 TonB-dependent receptor [Massilia horti]
MSKLFPIACLALLGTGGVAHSQDQSVTPATPAVQEQGQDQNKAEDSSSPRRGNGRMRGNSQPAAPAQADAQIQQVTISGSRADDTESRRLSTAAKMVFGREELDRNGDTSVGEVLKRLPGVTMGGAPGRGGGGIRMRGLGNGYTQMLVNGERPPPGFSLESLSPDQVERIEVMRGPVAEHSTQAIAGTINIILREGYQQKDLQLRVADNIEQGRHGGMVSLTMPGKTGNLTWLLTGGLMQHRQHNQTDTVNLRTRDLDNVVEREQLIHDEGNGKSTGIHLSPRLQYKFDNNDTLTFQPFLMSNRNTGDADTKVTQPVGSDDQLEYAYQHSRSKSSSTFLRGFGNWLHRMEAGAKLDVKFGFGGGQSDSDTWRNTFDKAGVAKRAYVDSDSTRERSLNTGGKFTKPLKQGHLFAAGWDVEAGHRSQNHVAQGDSAALFDDSGATFAADTRRVAAFVQDEWDITERWSAYLGLRWEGIRTTSSSLGTDVKNTSSVWSPVLHTVWRIPGREKDQLRASLTQSYKAPALNDMIAVPFISTTPDDPTRPDRIGNPNLKPELAKGIDLAYEHYLGKNGIVSASAFMRNIDNLMRRQTVLQQTGNGPRWVSTPINIGSARTSGIELEAKFPLTDLFPNAPGIDVRSNYSRFWSQVDGIPGPNNRLDQQPKQTANAGLDYRMKGLPLTVGGGLNWTPATIVQTTVSEVASTGVKRQFDLYGLWKFSPATQVRISANNLDPNLYETGRSVDAKGITQSAFNVARTYTTVGVRLETKL